MAVFPRASPVADKAQIMSPKVATKTVIGMVLGICECWVLLSTVRSIYSMGTTPCLEREYSVPIHHGFELPAPFMPSQEEGRPTRTPQRCNELRIHRYHHSFQDHTLLSIFPPYLP